MEFQDVVRRRKMVTGFDHPRRPGGRRPRAAERGARAGCRVQPSWAFLVLDTPSVRRFWEATAEDVDRPDEWLRGMMRAPVVICPARARRRPAALRRDGPTRTSAAGPSRLGHGHRDGQPADPADGDRPRPGVVLHRHPAGPRATVRTAFGIPASFDPVGVVTIGHRGPRTPARPAPRRRRRPMTDLVHHGHWGGRREHGAESIGEAAGSIHRGSRIRDASCRGPGLGEFRPAPGPPESPQTTDHLP